MTGVTSGAEKTVQITDEKDLEQFLKITVVQPTGPDYVLRQTLVQRCAFKQFCTQCDGFYICFIRHSW